MALRPELIRGVEVSRVVPDLGRLAVMNVEDLDTVVGKLPARPLGADRNERGSVLIVGNDIVQLDANRAARDLEASAKPPQHLSHAFR